MMEIRRWRPFAELEALRREVDRLFREAFREFMGEEPIRRGAWLPPVDVYETDTEVVVVMELPGIKKEDVTIELTDDVLTIRGKRERVRKEGETYHIVERAYGEFERRFNLGVPIDRERVEATFKDGVLTIRLPKAERVRPRKVEIKVE